MKSRFFEHYDSNWSCSKIVTEIEILRIFFLKKRNFSSILTIIEIFIKIEIFKNFDLNWDFSTTMKNFEIFQKIDIKLRFFRTLRLQSKFILNFDFDCFQIVIKIEVFRNFDWNRDLFQNCEWNCVLLIRLIFLEVLKKFKLFAKLGFFKTL